jgi:ribonucleoside-diphosphate reductase alpha chain
MSFEWLTPASRNFLKQGYLSEGVEPEERLREVAEKAQELLGDEEGYADKLYSYMDKGWVSLSSPVWANFGNPRGLPVSCFNSYIGDSAPEILYAQAEVGMMTKYGGGTSGYFGDVRPRGAPIKGNGKSSGAVHFMELFESVTDVVSQGATRRGRFAPYLPLSHGDIEEFLKIGTDGHAIHNLTTGVTATDEWLESMIAGDSAKRKTWANVLQARSSIGYPYVFFTDNANKNKPQVYKDKGMPILGSNLCSEIMLPSSQEESFVCVLSSVNLLHYDEWKDTDLIETMVKLLDAVVTDFLQKIEESAKGEPGSSSVLSASFMSRAYQFAKNHRALGLGVLGWHSLLQSKRLSMSSKGAAQLNDEVFSLIKERSYKASEELAEVFGEPPVLEGYGRRNTTLNAIAPTTSSAFILGQVSQSIEPLMSNYYIKNLAKAKEEIKNPELEKLLEEAGQNTPEVWKSIGEADGSVQHLPFLTDEEKEVFLTFKEIDPYTILHLAAVRQTHLDQSQSLNLMIDESWTAKELNELTLYAWRLGIPTLYYQHSVNAAQAFARVKGGECAACEA